MAVDCGSELECSCVICAHEHAGSINGRCGESLECRPQLGFAVVAFQVLRFDGRHNGEGVNVTFGNGSGRWADRRIIEEGPADVDEIPIGFPSSANTNMNNAWLQLDRAP